MAGELRERLRAARPMLVGRPHEAASNGSPRWMAVGPRSRGRTEPGLQAGSPAAYALSCANEPCSDYEDGVSPA
jgi:hypothetical protein